MKNRAIINIVKKVFLLFIILISKDLVAQKDSLIFIKSIIIEGNNKTKKNIILRELTFNVGDRITNETLRNRIKESKKNLLNTPLFNFCNFNLQNNIDGVLIIVKVEERWYIWPQASIYYVDRNFSNWLKNKDLTRIDVGLGLVNYNTRGRNEKLGLYTVFGYDNQLILNYNNIFLDNKRRHSVGFFLNLNRRKETSVYVENDKIQQVKLANDYALQLFRGSLKYTYRKKIFNKHSISLGYERRVISDSVLVFNPNYIKDAQTEINYFFLRYVFKRDKRNNRVFPTKGYLLKFNLIKNGIGVFNSKVNVFSVKSEMSKYTQLANRIYFANKITLKYKTNNSKSFFFNSALGYYSNIRGYEYYVINGTNFALSQNTLNINIIKKKVFNIKYLPLKRFNKIFFIVYGSVFSDFAYVNNSNINYLNNNKLANTFLYGYGIGLNVLTYYDKLFRLEYSTNHLQESGFYFHFSSPF